MDEASAIAALHTGSLVAIITIPKDFSYAIAHGQEVTLPVSIDNVNTDLTDDIQRALPSAIVAFGTQHHFLGMRVQVTEVDLIDHDTGFIPYLIVSGLALDAFLIASILSAMAVAREFETSTIKLLAVTPVHPLLSILGRMLATDMIAGAAMIFPVALAVFAYHIIPLHPLEMVGVILVCVAIFGCIGVALGAVLRRTLSVVSLLIGLGFPLYLCSGSLEPQRFDGNLIWAIAHLSPVYYAVGQFHRPARLGRAHAAACDHPFALGSHRKSRITAGSTRGAGHSCSKTLALAARSCSAQRAPLDGSAHPACHGSRDLVQ